MEGVFLFRRSRITERSDATAWFASLQLVGSIARVAQPTKQAGVVEVTKQAGVVEVNKQAGVVEVTKQAGVVEVTKQAGVVKVNTGRDGRTRLDTHVDRPASSGSLMLHGERGIGLRG
eukprot:1189985-Prorocentrum_minimum.AAC.2